MIKTHEINLTAIAFSQFTNSNHLILKSGDIEMNDYILVKQTETRETSQTETGLYRMTQVKEIVRDAGLKDGYILAIVNKL